MTREERNAIRSLKRLAKRWPKSLWLFAGGRLYVMRRPPGNEDTCKSGDGTIREDLIVDSVDIPNDGGGW